MDYADAVAALERALAFGINPSLEGIRLLTDELGRPQDTFASVQVTGTNGKTSTTRAVAAVLTAHGVRTGTYTSPHLVSYTERVEIDGVPVSEPDFAMALVAAYESAFGAGRYADDFTEFELLTAAALWLMRDKDVEVACLEVGMGGRWDATSIVEPKVAVITGVGLDHTDRLGDTVEEIAADKAHIIKGGSSVVLGPGTAGLEDVFRDRVAEVSALDPIVVREEGEPSPLGEEATVRFRVVERPASPAGRLVLDVVTRRATYRGLALVAPAYQAGNLATAIAASEAALDRALDDTSLRTAFDGLRFPGRFEVLDAEPPLIGDGAHNPQAASALAGAIAEAWPDPASRPFCVLGVLADKDAEGIVRALAPVCRGFIATQPLTKRALDAGQLGAVIARVTGEWPEVVPTLSRAIPIGRLHGDAAGAVVTGSLYMAGQAKIVLNPPEDAEEPAGGTGPAAARRRLFGRDFEGV